MRRQNSKSNQLLLDLIPYAPHSCKFLLDTYPDSNGMVTGRCECGKTQKFPFTLERAIDNHQTVMDTRYARLAVADIPRFVTDFNEKFYRINRLD